MMEVCAGCPASKTGSYLLKAMKRGKLPYAQGKGTPTPLAPKDEELELRTAGEHRTWTVVPLMPISDLLGDAHVDRPAVRRQGKGGQFDGSSHNTKVKPQTITSQSDNRGALHT